MRKEKVKEKTCIKPKERGKKPSQMKSTQEIYRKTKGLYGKIEMSDKLPQKDQYRTEEGNKKEPSRTN